MLIILSYRAPVKSQSACFTLHGLDGIKSEFNPKSKYSIYLSKKSNNTLNRQLHGRVRHIG